MTFAGESHHRCKCFGENEARDGTYLPCPPELCEADTLLLERDRYREALEQAKATALAFKSQGVEGSGWLIAFVDAALATPDTPPDA